jgi:N-acetylglucosamine malate deacetylase 1
MKKVLIISAHADDEVFGMGGTLAKMASQKNKYSLNWLILSSIWIPKWTEYDIESRNKAINSIYKTLGIDELIQWDYKDNMLDTYSINEMQEKMIKVFNNIKPNIIYSPSPWDFNFEHKLAFELVEMSSKSYYSSYIESIIAYEIPSSTEAAFKIVKNFPFNSYVNIDGFLAKKNDMIKLYDTEIYDFPHPRSEEYIRSLAKVRGAESGFKSAEAFSIVRNLIK